MTKDSKLGKTTETNNQTKKDRTEIKLMPGKKEKISQK